MSSIRNQVVELMVAALMNQTGAGDRVDRSIYRSRQRDEVPSISVSPETEDRALMGGGAIDDNVLVVAVLIDVRGDPWDVLADAVAVDAHKVLMTDQALKTLIKSIHNDGAIWQGHPADMTAGALTMKYRVRYASSKDDLTERR
jgi:hypothetical protein